MYSFLSDIYNYFMNLSLARFIRLFWFFFIFDFLRYIVLEMIVITLDLLKKHSKKEDYSTAKNKLDIDQPLISVLVPGKNEGKHIPELARSLHNQSYQNLEIIIVDDGSDDDTPLICRDLLRKGRIDKFFRNEVRGGKASAANLALRYATGKYIVHLDADSHLYEDAIEKLIIPFYLDGKIGAVGGDIRINNIDDSLAAALQCIEYNKTISVGRRMTSHLGILRIISGAFGAFRADVLKRLGGWDIGPGLDGDLTVKYRKLGYNVYFEPQAVCFTNSPTSFKKLAKQRYRWNRSMVRFRFRKHRDTYFPHANFSLLNLFSFLDNIIFNFVLNINWWIYIFDILFTYNYMFKYIFGINYFLYIMSNYLQFGVNLLLAPNKKVRQRELKLLIYIPIMPFYTGLYLRVVRSYAYFMELFFKKSYEDKWNPWKVSRKARDEGL